MYTQSMKSVETEVSWLGQGHTAKNRQDGIPTRTDFRAEALPITLKYFLRVIKTYNYMINIL